MQNDIKSIERWFQRSKNIDFEIIDAIDTSLEIIQNIHVNFKLIVTKTNKSTSTINGIFFIHFVDLFQIFFENIVDYSLKDELKESNAEINIYEDEEDVFYCTLKNKISKKLDLKELKTIVGQKIKLIKLPVFDPKIRTEGDTGIIKANNIIKNIFRCTTNEFNIKIEDNNYFTVTITICLKGLKNENFNN